MLNFAAALLNNWRVVLFVALIGFLTLFFVVNKARLTAAQNAADGYRAELLQYKTAAQSLSEELEKTNARIQETDKLLAQREQEKIAAEKVAATARKKYRSIVEKSDDACMGNAVPADVLGWMHDNTN
jgi:uncharacterized protein YlxW (UPF0749 family)